MSKQTQYEAKRIDAKGYIQWCDDDNDTWAQLYARQIELLEGRACDQYMHGIELLDLPKHKIPQLPAIDKVLMQETGWQTAAVPALINFTEFFTLLANKRFPVATFIRSKEEFDYLQEPDIFHEIFGHCPMLTNPAFANFTHLYGKLGLAASKEDRAFLARLYWFTVEFGLVQTEQGLRIYGGGILSSPGETIHALDSDKAVHQKMDVLNMLRTPYRIDIMQPLYFVLNQFNDLFTISEMDIMQLVQQAKALGLHAPRFAAKQKLAG